MKGVNSAALPILGIARRMRFKLGSWSGQTDFLVVKMDDFDVVLGMEFLLEHKAQSSNTLILGQIFGSHRI